MGELFLGIIAAAIVVVLVEWLLQKILPEKPKRIHVVAVIIGIIVLGIVAARGEWFAATVGNNANTSPSTAIVEIEEETPVPMRILTPIPTIKPTPMYTSGLISLIRNRGDEKVFEIMKPDGEFVSITDGATDFRLLSTSPDGKFLAVARSNVEVFYDSYRFPNFITTNYYDSSEFLSSVDEPDAELPEPGTSLVEQAGQGFDFFVYSVEDGTLLKVFEEPVYWLQARYMENNTLILTLIDNLEVVYFLTNPDGSNLRQEYSSLGGFDIVATITPTSTPTKEPTLTPQPTSTDAEGN